jgi:hypothetical protein
MRRYGTFWHLLLLSATALSAPTAQAQREGDARTVFPICIGDCRRVVGLRLNYRDAQLDRVDGINATIWVPYEPMRGAVYGVALGLPATGAGRINGLTLARLTGANPAEPTGPWPFGRRLPGPFGGASSIGSHHTRLAGPNTPRTSPVRSRSGIDLSLELSIGGHGTSVNGAVCMSA